MKARYLRDKFYIRFVGIMAKRLNGQLQIYDPFEDTYPFPSVFGWRGIYFMPESLK